MILSRGVHFQHMHCIAYTYHFIVSTLQAITLCA